MSDLYTYKMFARYAGEGYSFQPSGEHIHVCSKDRRLSTIVPTVRDAVLVIGVYQNLIHDKVLASEDYDKVREDLTEARLKLLKLAYTTPGGNSIFEGEDASRYAAFVVALSNNNSINTIKMVRAISHCSLKRAMEFLEEEFGKC